MELRTARKGEESLISDLAVKVFKPNMKEQFIRLFSPHNIDHMFVGVDQGKIISSVNYYIAHIESNLGVFKVASVGAVCTNQEYRGQGVASTLLEMAEKKMLNEHVDFCIISGRRGMYKRFGAKDCGAINRYFYQRDDHPGHIEIRKVLQNADELYTIYLKENIKYQRDLAEFEDLWKGQTYPDSYQTYHTYILDQNGKPEAYIIVIDHHEKDSLGIKEFAGNRVLIAKGLSEIARIHEKTHIEIMIPERDELNQLMKAEKEKITQQSTLKVIDRVSCLAKLNLFLKDMHIEFGYNEESGIYELKIQEVMYHLNHDEFHMFIFSGHIPESWGSKHQKTIHNVFPLELPWSHNLNYQ